MTGTEGKRILFIETTREKPSIWKDVQVTGAVGYMQLFIHWNNWKESLVKKQIYMLCLVG